MSTPETHDNSKPPLADAIGSVLPCPFCGCNAPHPALRMGFPVSVWCPACGATGPERLTGPEADQAWNDAKLRHESPPIALPTEYACVVCGMKTRRPDGMTSLDWIHNLANWCEGHRQQHSPPNKEVSDAGPLTPELKPKREPGIR